MRNVEAKFKLEHPALTLERAISAGFSLSAVLNQRDTFFRAANGKLKLREEESGARLIHYHRARQSGLELSEYDMVSVAEPERTRAMLANALGIIAEVRKERTLLLRENVRLHLDRVAGLGDFGEIEAVLPGAEADESNRAVVRDLLATLQIRNEDLIEVSYFELMHEG